MKEKQVEKEMWEQGKDLLYLKSLEGSSVVNKTVKHKIKK